MAAETVRWIKTVQYGGFVRSIHANIQTYIHIYVQKNIDTYILV